MLLPPTVKIHFATELVDMRNGIDGLRGLVVAALKKEPASGHLFVFVGKSRDKVKILAYQHFKQDCAWLPDSSSTSFDKINVRDGHYPLWGPLHLFAKVDANNVPTKPDAANLIGYFTGKVATPAGLYLPQNYVPQKTARRSAALMTENGSTRLGPASAIGPASLTQAVHLVAPAPLTADSDAAGPLSVRRRSGGTVAARHGAARRCGSGPGPRRGPGRRAVRAPRPSPRNAPA